MIVAAVVNYTRDRDFFDRAVSARGVITAVWREWDSDDDEYEYYARIRFATEDGQSYEFESGGFSDSSRYSVGKTVQIHHDPNNPNFVYVGGRRDTWIMPIAFGIIGLSITGFSIHRIFRNRKAAKRAVDGQSATVVQDRDH